MFLRTPKIKGIDMGPNKVIISDQETQNFPLRKFLLKKRLLLFYVCVFCLHEFLCITRVQKAPSGQKMASGSPELE